MGPANALFQLTVGDDIHVLTGCGLGGGSLVNAAVAMAPDQRVFAEPAWQDALADDPALAEGFARAARMLRPLPFAGAGKLQKYQALSHAGRALPAGPHEAPIAVTFEDTVNPAGIRQSACTLCGDCCAGCNVGAKNTVALTYLPDARAHGAELFTGAQVHHLTRDGDCWRIHFADLGSSPKSGPVPDRSITASIVVLAAGTLGSTGILLRSREEGLAVSQRLGCGFSANGDIIAFGYGADVPVNAIGVGHPAKADVDTVGPCVAGQVKVSDETELANEMYLQEGVMPSGLAPLLPVAFIPGGRLIGAAQSLVKGVYRGPFSRLHTFFVVSHDDAEGQIVLKGDGVAVHWPDVAKQEVYRRVDDVLERATQANGAKYVKNPLAGTFMGHQPATAHPLGGCAIGREVDEGVVNHKSQLFNPEGGSSTAVHDGLYVCDGAIMPRSLGVNPLFTITALAERAMIHLARDRGWSFDDEPRRIKGAS